jgi:hypothetical protein
MVNRSLTSELQPAKCAHQDRNSGLRRIHALLLEPHSLGMAGSAAELSNEASRRAVDAGLGRFAFKGLHDGDPRKHRVSARLSVLVYRIAASTAAPVKMMRTRRRPVIRLAASQRDELAAQPLGGLHQPWPRAAAGC